MQRLLRLSAQLATKQLSVSATRQIVAAAKRPICLTAATLEKRSPSAGSKSVFGNLLKSGGGGGRRMSPSGSRQPNEKRTARRSGGGGGGGSNSANDEANYGAKKSASRRNKRDASTSSRRPPPLGRGDSVGRQRNKGCRQVDGQRTDSDTSPSNNSVQHDKRRKRFSLDLGDGQLARIDYRKLADGKLELFHTEVPAALRGRGVGRALARGALEHAASANLRLKVTCDYLLDYVKRFADDKHKQLVD